MSPFVIIALVAGAFLLGRKSQKEEWHPPALRPGDLPDPRDLPGIDGSAEPLGHVDSDQGAMHDWSNVNFEVQIYPPGIDKRFVAPPPGPKAITTSNGCAAIAVGKMWWQDAGYYAIALYKAGMHDANALTNKILQKYASVCGAATTEAAVLFRDEIFDACTKLVNHPPSGGQGGGFGLTPNPARRNGRGARLPWRTRGARVIRSR